MKGRVYLIGAGPGDPGLLTVKGKEILARADVVVHDALIHPNLLQWAKSSAMRVFVGKRGHQFAKKQSEINVLLMQHAQRGRTVARIKGGDPLVFARGSEEAAFLAKHGVPFEIVPGVSAATGVAAYAGIPLTERHLSSMVTMVTGHSAKDKGIAHVDWPRISRSSTLVLFMGVDQLDLITERLLRLLWHRDTPAVAIRWGTTAEQQTVEGTLGTIASKVKHAGLTSPALIILGRVVALRKKLRWFDMKPLFGKTVVITRASEQAPEFARLLEEAGAHVLAFPTIQIVPPKSWQMIDKAIGDMTRFDWILFTSVNGVRAFFARLKSVGGDVRDLKGIRIGAIGPKTSQRLTDLGLRVDAFPDEYRGEALAKVVGEVRGARVLIARAQEARDALPKALEAKGAAVTIAPVYQTIKTRRVPGDLKERLLAERVHVVTFTSSSTVDGFMQHFTPRERRKIFETTKAAVIGPITSRTLTGYGVRPAIRAPRYTVDALAKAIVQHFS